MKKKRTIITVLLVIVAAIVAAIVYNRPYKPTSFVVDGDIFSATIENGNTMLLNLENDSKHIEWSITQMPENFTSDYNTVIENDTEFHIITLDDGEGVMKFQCVLDNGTTEQYELTLSISRHKKTYLQIDSVSFVEATD